MGIGRIGKTIGKHYAERLKNRFENPGSKSSGGGQAQENLNSAADVQSKIQIKRGSKNSGSKY